MLLRQLVQLRIQLRNHQVELRDALRLRRLKGYQESLVVMLVIDGVCEHIGSYHLRVLRPHLLTNVRKQEFLLGLFEIESLFLTGEFPWWANECQYSLEETVQEVVELIFRYLFMEELVLEAENENDILNQALKLPIDGHEDRREQLQRTDPVDFAIVKLLEYGS